MLMHRKDGTSRIQPRGSRRETGTEPQRGDIDCLRKRQKVDVSGGEKKSHDWVGASNVDSRLVECPSKQLPAP